MSLGNWLRRQLAAAALSMSNLEKNALGQGGEALSDGVGINQSHKKGMLSHDLKEGRVTQQVQELRWRMYKVLEEADKYSSKVISYDEDGTPTVVTTKRDLNKKPEGGDPYDDYEVEMIVDNTEITKGILGTLTDTNLELQEISSGITNHISGGTTTSGVTSGFTISNEGLLSKLEKDNPIIVERELRARFEIEKYTKKLYIRNIDDENKLLEFYINKYPDEFDRKTRLLVSEIKKAIKNPRAFDMLNIGAVGFITYKTIGVENFKEFMYEISEFDKIVEHNGHYIIKFKAKVVIDGDYVLEKYRDEGLDERYENKESKS